MLAPVTHILPITIIRRERVLPVTGKVLVRKGQKVSANDTIAEANLYPEHVLVDIAHGLGIAPQKADQYLQCKAGQLIAEGDILAGPIGISRRVVRATLGGRVALAENGQVLLELQKQPFTLKAGIPGDIVDLIPDRGASVETSGALIQGVWGNGHSDFGLMYSLAKTSDQELTRDQLDVSLRGSIILGGSVSQEEVLKIAADLPLRGLILASMRPALVEVAMSVPIPIMVVEGFGRYPMNSAAYKLLTTNERREVALNAEPWDSYEGTRPEIVIPLPAPGGISAPHEASVFKLGQQIHIVRNPFIGKTGIITGLKGKSVISGGLKTNVAEVRLETGDVVTLPLANLDVIE